MLSRLWNLGEDSGEKLEDVEGFVLRVAGEGVVVRSLSLSRHEDYQVAHQEGRVVPSKHHQPHRDYRDDHGAEESVE